MQVKHPKTSVRKKPLQAANGVGAVKAKVTTPTGEKAVIASGDKSAQVLAATVGGAVLGNLIAPGIGGALIGGLVGALLGNDSASKGRK